MSLSLCAHDNPTERRNGPAGYKSYIIPAFVSTCIGNTRSYLSFLVLSSISTFYRFFFLLSVLMMIIREVSISILCYILI